MKGKKWFLTPLTLLLVLTLVLPVLITSCTESKQETTLAPGEKISLKLATFFPPPSSQAKLLEEFCLELTARSGGQLNVEFFAGGSLLDQGGMYTGVVDGVADIGYGAIHYSAGRFLVSEVMTTTPGWPSAWVGAHVADDFYLKFQPKEWNDVQMLALLANEPKVIYTKEPVNTMEDLKGMIIRGPGRPGKILEALGATSAPTSTSELADAIAKGTVDGAFLPYETLKTFKTAEVVKYATACWNLGCADCFYMIMNKDAYAKVAAVPSLKTIFDDVCGEYKEKLALMWNSIDFGGLAYAQGLGVQVIELSDAEAAKWEAAAAPVVDAYVQEMVGQGYTEAEVRGWISYLNERIDYWTAKQIDWKILSVTGPAGMRP